MGLRCGYRGRGRRAERMHDEKAYARVLRRAFQAESISIAECKIFHVECTYKMTGTVSEQQRKSKS